MSNMICGGSILTWAFMATHAGNNQVISLFSLVHDTLVTVLAQMG